MSNFSRVFSNGWQDVRFGLRMLRRAPAFAAVAMLSLALGIGANVAVFTLFNAILLRMLPVRNPEALVLLAPWFRGEQMDLSYPMARDLIREQQALSGAAFVGSTGVARARFGPSIIEGVQFFSVSHEYFPMLGIQPAAGRWFTQQEDANPGSARAQELATVISFGFWEKNFARDPSVLGRRFELDRIPCRVVGVAPRGFFGHETGIAVDVWLPMVPLQSRDAAENRRRDGAFDGIVGRLRPGVSRRQAAANLTTVFRKLLVDEPRLGGPGAQPGSLPADYRVHLEPAATGMGHLRREYRTPLLILLAAVGLLLLIACANVTNLLLARGASRSRELGVRLALGATRRRIAAQLLAESLLLACGGAVLGLLFALWGMRVPRSFIVFGGWYSTALDVSPDFTVLVFLIAVTLSTALIFGAVPAWRQTAVDIESTLKISGRGHTATRQRLGGALVIVQIALSLVLVNGAVLLGRSLRNLHSTDLGFISQNLLAVFFNSEGTYSSRQQYLQLAQRIQERTEALPAVGSAAVSWLEPFYNYVPSMALNIPGYTAARDEHIRADYNIVSSGYFSTLGIRLLRGREFTAADNDRMPLVAVVNNALARRYFSGRPVLGSVFTIAREGYENRPFRIVGIVRDSKRRSIREAPEPAIYFCLNQLNRPANWIYLRTAADPEALVKFVRAALHDVSDDLVILKIEPLEHQVDETLRTERLLTQLISFFGCAALRLASIGVYGLLAFAVQRRTNEIGVRMALGARPEQILAAVFRDTLALVFAGGALGIVGVIATTSLPTKFLYGIAPRNPGTIAVSLSVLTAVAIMAAWLPARRASRVDPVAALRAE